MPDEISAVACFVGYSRTKAHPVFYVCYKAKKTVSCS